MILKVKLFKWNKKYTKLTVVNSNRYTWVYAINCLVGSNNKYLVNFTMA